MTLLEPIKKLLMVCTQDYFPLKRSFLLGKKNANQSRYKCFNRLLIRLFICIFFAGLMLYKYIDKLNALTELRLSVPALAKEVKEIHEKNLELQYEIEQFDNPLRLLELLRTPEFEYLKYPSLDKVIQLPESSPEKEGINE